MERAPRQLPLLLPHRPDMDRDAFLSGPANREALALIDRWPDWPSSAVLLSGPSGSGKSHLAQIWRERSDALLTSASDLASRIAEGLPAGAAVLVEDLDAPPLDEAGLFHLLNLARETGSFVLMTSRVPAAGLAIGLPDLLSRLRAAHALELGAPDDEMLRLVLAKLFADRQLRVEKPVFDFLLRRMERSFASARELVERLDREALAEGRSVTRTLAATVLGEGSQSE